MRLVSLLLATVHIAVGQSPPSHHLRGRKTHPFLYLAIEQHPERRIQSKISSNVAVFTEECMSILLSPTSIEDGIISQDEYASFLYQRCHAEELCGSDELLDFEHLSLNLQLSFVRGVCPYDDVGDRIGCIQELEAMWLGSGIFGYQVPDNDLDLLSGTVEDMCMNVYGYAIELGLIRTVSPTLYPSEINTTEPSIQSTNEPSQALQNAVSSTPSIKTRSTSPFVEPTASPSNLDSIKPTAASTMSLVLPTQPPSSQGENKATGSPLSFATNSPTFRPNLFNGPDPFVDECKTTLLSAESIEDGTISQIEFADFLASRCKAEGLCGKESKIAFEELDVGLQLDFILGVCFEDTEDCISSLEADWRNGSHFGFDAKDEHVADSLEVLCLSAFEYAVSVGLVTTSVPTSMPSNTPTIIGSQVSPPSLPTYATSKMPSGTNLTSNGDEFPPTENRPLGPKKSIVGVSAALAFFILAAGGVLLYKRAGDDTKKSAPCDHSPHDPYYYAASINEPWGRVSPFPFSISSSCSSSSSSFRDYRFVPVFANGESVLQFDPNTADAVVIGSVTIGGGGGSSSISTGPSNAYITIGQVNSRVRAKSEANSGNSSSGLSSMSSETSETRNLRSKFFGSFNDLASEPFNKSIISRHTTPMTKVSFERHVVRFDHEASFADWKAASHMVSEYRNPEQATDAHAASKQREFFFNLFTSQSPPDDSGLSTNASPASIQSLGLSPMHDKGESSVREVTSSEVLVPWRRGGFSSAFQMSDGKQSEESACSSRSAYNIEHWDSINIFASKQRSKHPVHSVLSRVKGVVAGWVKRKQYHHLNERLQEDLSVISMKSYSSNIQLLPNINNTTAFGLPGLILGTWAGATIPIQPKHRQIYSQENQVHDSAKGTDGDTKLVPTTTADTQLSTSSPPSILGIAKRNYIDDLCEGESRTGLPSSFRQNSFVSSCSSSWNNDNNSCFMRTSISRDNGIPLTKDGATIHINESRAVSEGGLIEDFMLVSKNGESKSIVSSAIHSNASANVISDSSGSFHTEDFNVTKNIQDTIRSGPYNQNQIYSHSSQKVHDRNFFMMLANDIEDDTTSVEHTPRTNDGDWSHNISATSSDSMDTADNEHSLSLSLESEADSASQALDWAITREVSKQLSTGLTDSVIAKAE